MRLELTTFSLEGCNASVVSDGPANTYETTTPRLADSLADLLQNDPDLAAVIRTWPGLPEAVRAGIVAMVKAASCTTLHGDEGHE